MKHREELSIMPDYIAQDLYEAAVWVLERARFLVFGFNEGGARLF